MIKESKRLIAWLLIVTLALFQASSIKVMANNVKSTPDPYTMTLCGKNSDDSPGVAIASGASISLITPLFIKISWETLANIQSGVVYELDPFSDVIGAPKLSGSKAFSMDVFGEKKDFATLTWEKDVRVLKVKFNDLGTTDTGDSILNILEDVNLYFACNLDANENDANEKGEIKLQLKGSAEITITIKELQPSPPEVKKEVSDIDDSGVTAWGITYNHPVASYQGDRPAKLSDSIPAGMEYVADSLTLTVNGIEESDHTAILIAGQNITYVLPSTLASGEEVFIGYKTKLTAETMTDIWASGSSREYKNTVTALKSDDTKLDPNITATANLPVSNENWNSFNMISKNGVSIAGTPQKINWTVTVNTASKSFKTLKLIDTMGKGLILDENSVIVNGLSHIPTVNGKTTMTIDLVKNGSPNPASQTYTIIYTTSVDPNYFDQNNTGSTLTDADLENAARLEYEWPDGEGPGNPHMPPTITKGPGDVGISGSLISKKSISYDATNHSILWEATLNPNKVDLTTAKIVDTLSPSTNPHLFIPGNDVDSTTELAIAKMELETAIKDALVKIQRAPDLLTSFDITNETLTAELASIGNESLTFQYKTYVSDPTIWAGNVVEKVFDNTVTLVASGTSVSSMNIATDVVATAIQKYTSVVLEKAHTSYNPETKKLSWTITVNKNKTMLGDVTITDKLPELLSCDITSAKIDNGNFDGVSNSFKAIGKEITIKLSNVTSEHIITFDTNVNVDHSSARILPVIPIENTAKMISTVNTQVVNSNKATLELHNPVVSKTSSDPNTNKNNFVKYTVQVNPLGINLAKTATGAVTLKDTMADGLYLDLDSVQLNEAIVTSVKDGTTYKTELTSGASVYNLITKYDAPTNSFTVKIPDAGKSYILTYTAFIVRSNVELSNNVEMLGSLLPDSATNNEATSKFKLVAFGSAGFRLPADKFFSVEIKKTDESGAKLAGAEFGLYSGKNDANLLAKAVCDESTGVATLGIAKSVLGNKITKLYWKEIKAPSGYLLNDEWREVDTTVANPAILSMVNVSQADAGTAEILIQKVDELGAPLTGASFALYKDEKCTRSAKPSTVVGSDGKLKFTNLDPGRTYWVKEIKAPSGYALLKTPVAVVAQKTATLQTIANQLGGAGGGAGSGGSNTGGGSAGNLSADFEIDVENKLENKNNDANQVGNQGLPRTGVTGIWFWAVGLTVALLGIVCVGTFVLVSNHIAKTKSK